jgi:hypothetical protein
MVKRIQIAADHLPIAADQLKKTAFIRSKLRHLRSIQDVDTALPDRRHVQHSMLQSTASIDQRL